MNVIQTIKQGSVINLSINGKLEKKICSSPEEATKIYKMVLSTKENPTDEAVKKLYAYLNDTTRIATIAGFEVDVVDGKVYLEGFNTPVPQSISDIILEYYENDFPYQSIVNFWKLLMVNPDVRVRETLFDFLTKYNFVLTENGYFVTYKAVEIYKSKNDTDSPKVSKSKNNLTSFVNDNFIKVKSWKKSAKNFTVYQKDGKYLLSETKKFKGNATTIGVLNDLYVELFNISIPVKEETKIESVIYTDKHTRTMRIKLGQVVKQERDTCVGDPSIECASSLHSGSVIYVQNFANKIDTILSCLINPAHVVAVPKHDNTKLRSCEYFPLSVVDNFHSLSPNSQQSFFESDYIAYEKKELEKQIKMIKDNQLPIKACIDSKKEERSMDELLKIIESRLVDIK